MTTEGSFDWCSFFALFWNDKGFKCKINIPDTVLFRYGQLSAWWATNKEGYIQRHASHNTSIEAIRRRLIQVAECDEANYSKFVSIVGYAGDGQPRLLRLQAFNQLCELLSDRIEAGHTNASPEVETPQVLQAFIQPYNDMRYITTYLGGGANNVSVHTFQRKFSRRYVAQGAPAPAAADALLFSQPDMLSSGSGAYAASGLMDETPDPVTGQGSVDPALKMEFRKLTSHLVKYIEKAHHLTLAGIVVEWIRDANGKIYLLSVLRTEWASNASGHGAGSLSAANLTEEPVELEVPPSNMIGAGELPSPPPPPPLQPAADSSEYGMGGYGYGSGGNGAAGGGGAGAGAGMGAGAGPLPSWGSGGSIGGGGGGGAPLATSASGSPVYAPPPPGVSLTPASRGTMSVTSPGARPTSALGSAPPQSPVGEVRPPGVAGVGAGTTMSHLAAYPGGARGAGVTVAIGNTWPSHQHESQLGSPTGGSRIAFGAFGGGGGQPTLSPRQPHSGGTQGSPNGYGAPNGSYSPSSAPYSSPGMYGNSPGGGGGGGGGYSGGRIQSARPAPNASTPMAERQGTRPPRPGSSPTAFGRAANASPLRNSVLGIGPAAPLAGNIPNNLPTFQERSPSPGPGAPRNASPPVRARPGTATASLGGGGGGTGHVNAGNRGAPLMMQQLTRDLEAARDQLLVQNQLAEASAAKVRQLEREKELMIQAYDQKVSELQSSVLVTRQDYSALRQEAEEYKRRAEEAESRVVELESRNHALQSTLDGERGTVMTALRECHERDTAVRQRAEQLETEVLRLTERLKEETAVVAALKRQLTQYGDIADRYAATSRETDMEPGMKEVMDKVARLFNGQANPLGEQYALHKVLHHYHSDLRAVFLYYAQLDNNFSSYWPPGMAFAQWLLFCRETETSDPRSNSRVSSVTQPHKMLHPRDCESIFRAYARLDPNAINTTAPVLTYEGFLCAIIDAAFRVKRPDNPYLSESVREYILQYVARASKMSPNGLRRGQMRDAYEGTKEGPPVSPGGTVASKSAGKAAKKKSMVGSVAASGMVRVASTTGTNAGGSLAASRPASAVSRKAGALHGAIEADLAMASNSGRL